MILFTKLSDPSTPESYEPRDIVRISALVPALDCEDTVGRVTSGLLHHVEDVLVVDDGSRDATAEVARAAGARVVRAVRNGGKGTAVRLGLDDLLKGPATHIAFVDADGQHDPDDLPGLIAAARRGADFIIGSRLRNPDEMPAKNYWANTIGDKVLSRMTGLPVEDGQSGYRLIATRLLRPLHLTATRYAIENEILIKACRRVRHFASVPVKSIYGAERRHYRPFRDTWVTSWASVHFKTTGSDES